jgi:cold-inducible RNA-binding protein
MATKLFVQNLPFTLSELDLRDAFAQHGTVTDMLVPMERDTGRPRGFAYVTMSCHAETEKVIAAMNGRSLAGRILSITEAKSEDTVRAEHRRSQRYYR